MGMVEGSTYEKTLIERDKKGRDMMIGGLGHDSSMLLAPTIPAGSSIDEIAEKYGELLKALIKVRDTIK